MRVASWVVGIGLTCVGLGCGGGTTPPAAPPGPDGCEIGNVGQLVNYTFEPGPQPAPLGGPITDGVYDLVQMIAHGRAPGDRNAADAASLRMSMKLVTEDRAAGAQGRVVVALNVPPAFDCAAGRFAAVGNHLRTMTTNRKIDNDGYTSGPDTLWVFDQRNLTYVFRLRR